MAQNMPPQCSCTKKTKNKKLNPNRPRRLETRSTTTNDNPSCVKFLISIFVTTDTVCKNAM